MGGTQYPCARKWYPDPMAPIEDSQDTAPSTDLPGSGEFNLEIEITKMRGAIIRTVNELDLFSRSVRDARIRVEQLRDSLNLDEPHE